jgi:hypothetical protein
MVQNGLCGVRRVQSIRGMYVYMYMRMSVCARSVSVRGMLCVQSCGASVE